MDQKKCPVTHEKLAAIRDAVLGIEESTKAATDDILAHCEAITSSEFDVVKAAIYQACAVQDLTHQRVKKILDLVQQIESGIFTQQDALLEGPQRQGQAMSQDDVDSLLNGDE